MIFEFVGGPSRTNLYNHGMLIVIEATSSDHFLFFYQATGNDHGHVPIASYLVNFILLPFSIDTLPLYPMQNLSLYLFTTRLPTLKLQKQ